MKTDYSSPLNRLRISIDNMSISPNVVGNAAMFGDSFSLNILPVEKNKRRVNE
jgi:hypothetical protein